MLSARHRFPSRGSMTVPSAVGGRAEGPMLTPMPPEQPQGMFRSGLPVQDLNAAGVRELQISMLDAPTAIRLGGTSANPRYFGTVLPNPTVFLSPTEPNSEDEVRAGVRNGGNAPAMANKSTAQGGDLEEGGGGRRIARSLPRRRR